jgi:hypothetical protein
MAALTDRVRGAPTSARGACVAGKYESGVPFVFGAWLDILDAANELLRPPVPFILRGVLRGGAMCAGSEMLRAGLYVGLGSLGKAAAIPVSSGNLGGGREGGSGMSRGPITLLEDWKSAGDGILTDRS